MGNTNSQPIRDPNADVSDLHRSRSPAGRRHPGFASGPKSASSSPSSARASVKGTPVFGRIGSHDESGSLGKARSRSGSLGGSVAGLRTSFRRGSEAGEPKDHSQPARHQAIPEYEIAAQSGSSAIESVIRKNSTPSRRPAMEPSQPGTPQGFDPRHFVSPHPSPSVATHVHNASGLSSHRLASGSSGSGPVSSAFGLTVPNEIDEPGSAVSQPQQMPSATAYTYHKHPLFGIGGGGIFPNAGNSLSTTAATSPPPGGASPTVSSIMTSSQLTDNESLPSRPPAALPSYLKIPTTIPSTYASATTPPAGAYGQPSLANDDDDDYAPPLSPLPHSEEVRHSRLLSGGGAAAAKLDPVEIVIGPGHASRVSSPVDERRMELDLGFGPDKLSKDGTAASAVAIEGAFEHERPANRDPLAIDTAGEEDGEREPRSRERATVEEASDRANSRTPTPTPGAYGPRAMTPTAEKVAPLRPISPTSTSATSEGPPVSSPTMPRKTLVDVQTGGESGMNTPALPPGLISAPPSAAVPAFTRMSSNESEQPKTPTGQSAASTVHPADRDAVASRTHTPSSRSTASSQFSTPTKGQGTSQLPLMPIALTWNSGGREVFVTGTFANEWRSKILLHRSKRDHSCVLHLPPGTHRLKFIVDDRWRVSRGLPTATDGDGNLVNYVEIPNVGPAHPGPLSAPGEDLPGERERRPGHTRDRSSKIESKRTTMDLVEEARKAQAARRGELDDFFGLDDAESSHETWTREIPSSLLAAQQAEEEYRDSLERGDGTRPKHATHERGESQAQVSPPLPPALPRQLEKVILNSSPANVAGKAGNGTVDDNSILPAPNHVVLNHLTASSIKGGVLAVGTTTRYKRKYVTTVYYRPVQV